MHEYAVVDELITSLLPRLDGIAGRVSAVFVRKGELRILSARALENAFELLARGTRLEGARLEVEDVAAGVRCRDCAYEGRARYFVDEAGHYAIPVLACPRCGGEVTIVAGRELCVDRVAVNDDASPPDPAKASPER
jgi:hydrogenase nickel incorporation protein HypA/HybF